MKKIKLAVTDDHEMFRKAISKLIDSEIDMEVIIEAENGLNLLDQLKKNQPDVILMDIRMPIMNGLEATIKIKQLYPNLKIIAFSQYYYEENIIEMNIHGAKSFIGKTDKPDELFTAIRVVFNGGVYMTSQSAQIVQKYLTHKSSSKIQCSLLNDVEAKLVKGICDGLGSKELAELLYKSPRTIEKYRHELYRKFNVANKEQLIAKVSRRD